MAKLVKPPAPDSVSGHDLLVREIELHVGLCADRVCLGFSVSLSL